MNKFFKTALFCLFSIAFFPAWSQQSIQKGKTKPEYDEILADPFDAAPQFPGGHEAMLEFLDEHIVYPAKQETIAGKVFLGFIVTKDGEIKEIKVLKSLEPSYDKAAIEAVKKMPKWTPAKSQKGESVNVRYTLPVQFNLYQKNKIKTKTKQ